MHTRGALVTGVQTCALPISLDPNQPRFLIFARTGGAPRLVGGCGISPSPEGPLEMGYWIARPYWGLGFATEAGRQLLHIARAMNLPKLSAGHFVDNPASGAVQIGRAHV